MMATNQETITVAFTSRNRAKDATLALKKIDVEDEFMVKVTVITPPAMQKLYVVECAYPAYMTDEVRAVLILGDQFDEDVTVSEINEVYAGAGLSRFRGI